MPAILFEKSGISAKSSPYDIWYTVYPGYGIPGSNWRRRTVRYTRGDHPAPYGIPYTRGDPRYGIPYTRGGPRYGIPYRQI
jgi:hypothetical protein